jgi:hypothetical protein
MELVHIEGTIEKSKEERVKYYEVIENKESACDCEKSDRDSKACQGFILARHYSHLEKKS